MSLFSCFIIRHLISTSLNANALVFQLVLCHVGLCPIIDSYDRTLFIVGFSYDQSLIRIQDFKLGGGGVGQKLIQSSKLSATDKQTKQD